MVFFQIVNLPVEFDASARAKVELVQLGIVPADEMPYVNSVLNAAAWTYVAATLQAVLTLLYYIVRFSGRSALSRFSRRHGMGSQEFIQVVTSIASQVDARRIANALVEQRLAGCVQIVGPIESLYRWEGKIETANEWQCWIKTRRSHYEAVEQVIHKLHPYQVPEILALPVIRRQREVFEVAQRSDGVRQKAETTRAFFSHYRSRSRAEVIEASEIELPAGRFRTLAAAAGSTGGPIRFEF